MWVVLNVWARSGVFTDATREMSVPSPTPALVPKYVSPVSPTARPVASVAAVNEAVAPWMVVLNAARINAGFGMKTKVPVTVPTPTVPVVTPTRFTPPGSHVVTEDAIA